jgi:hypothetical protein
MGASCSRCFGWTDDDANVNNPHFPLRVNTDNVKDGERQPLLNNEHPMHTPSLWTNLMSSVFHQPPQRNLQDFIHEEESLKQIVDRTRAYNPLYYPH